MGSMLNRSSLIYSVVYSLFPWNSTTLLYKAHLQQFAQYNLIVLLNSGRIPLLLHSTYGVCHYMYWRQHCTHPIPTKWDLNDPHFLCLLTWTAIILPLFCNSPTIILTREPKRFELYLLSCSEASGRLMVVSHGSSGLTSGRWCCVSP